MVKNSFSLLMRIFLVNLVRLLVNKKNCCLIISRGATSNDVNLSEQFFAFALALQKWLIAPMSRRGLVMKKIKKLNEQYCH